jgi:hypothetical protein
MEPFDDSEFRRAQRRFTIGAIAFGCAVYALFYFTRLI